MTAIAPARMCIGSRVCIISFLHNLKGGALRDLKKWPGRESNPDGLLDQRILSPQRLPVPPPGLLNVY